MAAAQIWTAEERAWATQCFRSGDSVSEIAQAADRTFLDVALMLGVYGFVAREQRWRPCGLRNLDGGGPMPSPWVGGMLKEVAVYRCRRGEEPMALAELAQANRTTMFRVLKGLVSRRRRLPAPMGRAA